MVIAAARGRFDPLIDLAGPLVPAICGGVAGWFAGPLYGYSPIGAALGASAVLFLGGFAFMRAIGDPPAAFPVPPLAVEPIVVDELLLDTRWDAVAAELDELWLDQPLRTASMAEIGELVLDDALPAVTGSRVVQLFEPQQLKDRIDRHLANALAATGADAGEGIAGGDALTLALAELKRSLRRG